MKTALTELLGIEHPIIQAGMTAATSAELAVAVSEAGALGSISASLRSAVQLQTEVAKARASTDKPFAVNFVVPMLNPDAYEGVLSLRPSVIVLAVGCSADLIGRAHDEGAKVLVQVNTVSQANRAVADGADALVAQGAESGGFTGMVGTMTLVPQVVEAVAPVPVVAAGGIFDGRGLAAALALGASGVNVGTRFLAASESPILKVWQERIVDAASEDAKNREFLSVLNPPSPLAFPASPRTLDSDFIEDWQERSREPDFDAGKMVQAAFSLAMEGRLGEIVPFAGQSAGAVKEVQPVAQIVRSMMLEYEAAAQDKQAFR